MSHPFLSFSSYYLPYLLPLLSALSLLTLLSDSQRASGAPKLSLCSLSIFHYIRFHLTEAVCLLSVFLWLSDLFLCVFVPLPCYFLHLELTVCRCGVCVFCCVFSAFVCLFMCLHHPDLSPLHYFSPKSLIVIQHDMYFMSILFSCLPIGI